MYCSTPRFEPAQASCASTISTLQATAKPFEGCSFGSLGGEITSVGDHGALATQPSDSGRPAWQSILAWPLACGRAR